MPASRSRDARLRSAAEAKPAHLGVPALRRGQRAKAAHGQHVQPVMRMIEDFVLAPADEVAQQLLADVVDLPLRRLGAVALAAIQVAQAGEGRGRVGLAGGGHAPGADRRADQRAFARRRRQPVAEQELVERLENQALGPAGGGRHDADVGRAQAVRTQARQRGRPGMKGK